MSASSRNSPSHMDDAGVTRWDRPRWISVFSSHNPTIREVTECLGLGLSASSSTTNRGIPKFDNPEYRKLSGEVTRLSKELPKERDALLDFAADPTSLHKELDDLLSTFGAAIWGRNTDRSCLLSPDPSKKTYPRHLFVEDPDDKEILKIHLHRWIIIKACYYIRNMKLKRPSSANEYDHLADMDAEADPNSPSKPQLSPNDTPQSLTPSTDGPTTAGADLAVKPINAKKRKTSAYASLSDGDDLDSTPAAKRFQNHTMPISRSSPRKSIFSIVPDGPASENVPPMPSLSHSHSTGSQVATNGASSSDSARPQLTTLSSNDLNGTARILNSAPPASGFTAVNTSSFTSINTSPPNRISPSQKPVALAPSVNGRSYSSPYDSSPFQGAPIAQKASTSPKALPLVTATVPASTSSFQPINSPVVANGVSTRDSPNVQQVQPPQLASQQVSSVQAQPQPTSRSNTPIMHHHHHRTTLTQQRSSRSSTPIAPSTTSQPLQPAPPAQVRQSPRPNSVPLAQAPAPSVTQPPGAPYVQHVANPRLHHVNVAPAPPAPPVPAAAVYNASQPPAILRSHPSEVTSHGPTTAPDPDLGLLQCEVLGSLLQYLFPRVTSPPDEHVLLHKMESLWHVGTPHFRKEIGQLYELQSKVLLTWITERRKIAQLRHTFAFQPVPGPEMIERLLALNDLRMMRLKWKNMSSAVGLSTEDLLCRTFTTMTNTAGTEHLFKDGLHRLNEGIFEFLKSEDMRILMHSKR